MVSNSNTVRFFVIFVLFKFSFGVAHASPEEFQAKGLKEFTAAEESRLNRHRIKRIKPNQRALKRLNKERRIRGEREIVAPIEPGNEIELGSAVPDPSAEYLSSATPAQVDNSQLPSFPTIANQGAQSSCVAWATTYYTMSHEVCLALGCDNKVARDRVFSPKWTYNMINGGVDNGAYFSDAFELIHKHGAAMLSEFPYSDKEFRAWDLNSNHWLSAIQNRVSEVSAISVNTSAGIVNAKQLLANGHVLVLPTFITSWQFRNVQADPSEANNPFAGQFIAIYLNGKVGGHGMTIVGYDDSIWTDINGNGVVEESEKGAFKIANSWGSGWRNAGFAWASYDAFRSVSAVPNFSPANRVQLSQNGNAYSITYAPYSPTLVARFTLSAAKRNQMQLRLGVSSASAQAPEASFDFGGLSGKGGAYAFDGSNSEIPGTFYVDLSSLHSGDPSQKKFYLMARDTAAGSPTSVNGFDVVIVGTMATHGSAAGLPAQLDVSSGNYVVNSTYIDTLPPTVPTNLNGKVVKVKNKKRVVLSWTVSSDNDRVAYYKIYRNGVAIGQSATSGFSDLKTAKGGKYSYQVLAVDAAGNLSELSNAAYISR